MRVENKKLLEEVGNQGRCELCRRRKPTSAHHAFTRGAGRLDIRCILVCLCMECHADAQNAKISQYQILAIIGKREKTTPDAITQCVFFFRALPKNPTSRQVETGMRFWEFSKEGLELAKRVWEEINA